MRKRLYIIAAVILLIGMSAAAIIYQAAGTGESGPDYELDTRMYRHNLELYGGKFNLITDEFMRWFAGLWHGRPLAVIVACAAVIASLVLVLAARHRAAGNGGE